VSLFALYEFHWNRYRELDFKSGLVRTDEFIFFKRLKKTNQKKAAPDDASLWLGFDFLLALAEGASCPSAKERHPCRA